MKKLKLKITGDSTRTTGIPYLNLPEKVEEKCKDCEFKPGGLIPVEDVKNPHCSNCGRKLIAQPIAEWEKEFEEKFNLYQMPEGLKDWNPEFMNSKVKTFISSLLLRKEEELREKIEGMKIKYIPGGIIRVKNFENAKLEIELREEILDEILDTLKS